MTRFLLRWDEFEAGTRALSDRNGTQVKRILRGEAGGETPGAATRSELRGCLVCKAARDAARRAALSETRCARSCGKQWTDTQCEEDENRWRTCSAAPARGIGSRPGGSSE